MKSVITFKPLSSEDCNQLHQWLQLPHVREFWDDGNRTIEQTESYYYRENGVDRFIFLIDCQPIGYIQSYDAKLHAECKKFCKENKKTVGVDFFIGNKAFLGKGFAKIIMQEFIKLHCVDAVRVIVDPDPKNSRAIHVYEACGFVKHLTCLIENKVHEIMFYEKSE